MAETLGIVGVMGAAGKFFWWGKRIQNQLWPKFSGNWVRRGIFVGFKVIRKSGTAEYIGEFVRTDCGEGYTFNSVTAFFKGAAVTQIWVQWVNFVVGNPFVVDIIRGTSIIRALYISVSLASPWAQTSPTNTRTEVLKNGRLLFSLIAFSLTDAIDTAS